MWIYWYSDTLHNMLYWYSDNLHSGDACALSLRQDAGHGVSIWFWHPKVCVYIDILKPCVIYHIDILTSYIQAMLAHCRFAKTQRTVFLFDSDTLKNVFILIFWNPTWYVIVVFWHPTLYAILIFWHPTYRRCPCIVALQKCSTFFNSDTLQ